jgi:Flp pilus assembly pilin Flp
MKVKKNIRQSKRGAALVEYGLIVAGVALVAAAAVSVFGSKAAGLVAASARILPGANQADNKAIDVSHIVSVDASGTSIKLDNNDTNLNQDVAEKLGIGQNTDLINDPNNTPH